MPIFIEPSRDIHVTLDASAPQLRLAVLLRVFNAPTNRFTFTDVTPTCQFDYFAPGPPQPTDPPNREFSRIDPATGLVTAVARGVNLVQVRRPGPPPEYLIARIEVHGTMNGWWLGHSTLTTALDTVAHTQVSIYALFDFNAAEGPNSGVVGDVTGHGYVNLASSNAATFQVLPGGRGFIRGMQEAGADLTATFMGRAETIPVRVVNYDRERPLERVDHYGPASEKLNILFLSEGFTAGQKEKFDEAVEKVKSRLFDAHRHSPYHRLKKSFNVWKVFTPSQEIGITNGPDFATDGQHIPSVTYPSGNIYTLPQLVEIVGLPSRADAALATNVLRTRWQALNLAGYVNAQANDEVVNAWKTQVPRGKTQARDSFFGMYYGSRFADPQFRADDPANPVTNATAATQPQRYQQRMFEWFRAPLVVRLVSADVRRHAREVPHERFIARFIRRLVDAQEPAASPNRAVGQLWAPQQTGVFARNRGLVCMLVHDQGYGGANADLFTTVSLGGQKALTDINLTESQPPPVRVRRLTRDPKVSPSFDEAIDTVAHEFGHSFFLGDEYEEFRRMIPPAAALPADVGAIFSPADNVALASEVQLVGAPPNPAAPLPIDADRVKWFDLHRMELSDAIVQPSQPAGGQLLLRLGPKRAKRWKKAKEKSRDVFLRSLNVRPGGAQLPIVHDDRNFIPRMKVVDVNESNDTVSVGGADMPIPPPVMPAGSVLYIPKRTKNNQDKFVVEPLVLSFMTNLRVPLTENHNAAEPTGCDQLQTAAGYSAGSAPEYAPGNISGFHYPSNRFEVIGLYEGGGRFVGGAYRPAGLCKMRSKTAGNEGRFCFVCKYLIVNRVDASRHDELDDCEYPEDC